jgi:hypothetical protein
MGLGKPTSKWISDELVSAGSTFVDFLGSNTGTATSGNARRFNGTTDLVQFANQIIPLGAKTIKFKFKRNGAPGGMKVIMDNADYNVSGANGTSVLVGTGGEIYVYSYIGSGVTYRFALYSGGNYCDNRWHEIMFTWDGTVNANGAKLYIDNMTTPIVQATATSTETTAAKYNLCLARTANSGTNFGTFDIDDIYITNAVNGGTVAAWWKMDDSAATAMVDSSANAWVPTITGTTVLTNDSCPIMIADGTGKYARHFNGRSDRITFTTQTLSLGAKTIKFKIRKNGVPSSLMVLMANANGDTENGTNIAINATTGTLRFLSGKGATPSRFTVNSVKNICDGLWHDVQLVWDGTLNANGVQIYIDNMTTPDAQGTAVTLETANATNNLMMGMSPNGTALFEGDIKDVQINVGLGTERTHYKDMQIGDFIASTYMTTNAVVGSFSKFGITPASFILKDSNAPNGGLYFVYVGNDDYGRKMLMSDRIIQQGVAWDVLNNNALTTVTGMPFVAFEPDSIVPPLTSNTAPSPYVVTTSTVYTAGYEGNKAFDNSLSTSWACSGTSGWIQIDLGVAKTIYSYSIRSKYANDVADNVAPKAFTLQGSNDGTNWTVVDTRTNEFGWKLGEVRVYNLSASATYRYYKLNITLNNGYVNYTIITDLRLNATKPVANFNAKLLTGGIDANDKDNEWDQLLVLNNLNGTIIAGDNNFWNTTTAWSETRTASGLYRVVRGSAGISARNSMTTSDTALANTGLRPMIVIEDIPNALAFVKVGTDYKKYTNAWATVSTTLPSEDTFKNEGMNFTIFDRKPTIFVQGMTNNGVLGNGKVFKSNVDIKKYFDLIGLNVT